NNLVQRFYCLRVVFRNVLYEIYYTFSPNARNLLRSRALHPSVRYTPSFVVSIPDVIVIWTLCVKIVFFPGISSHRLASAGRNAVPSLEKILVCGCIWNYLDRDCRFRTRVVTKFQRKILIFIALRNNCNCVLLTRSLSEKTFSLPGDYTVLSDL